MDSSRLASHLRSQAANEVTLTWSELDRLVCGLPASAAKHRAWWSGNRTHVLAWRAAGFTLGDLEMGREVTFVREPRVTSPSSTAMPTDAGGTDPAPTARQEPTSSDIVLVACVKSKRPRPAAAKDLYTSPLFLKERAFAERSGVPWFILSAEHGLVAPDEWLAPYERYLADTPLPYREVWGAWVAARLELIAGPLAGKLIEIHAGSTYLAATRPHLEALGATILDPLSGLTMGERLAWYNDQTVAGHVGVPAADAASFVALLLDESKAVSPATFLASKSRELQSPGLYSWWVDEDGAVDLTQGLGVPLQKGLIYAGLAGATRWPSGKRSTNTLWSRISGMHLGGNHEFSTFRRTLGAILASAAVIDRIDEAALTAWMHRHLRVIAAPYHDGDTLGRLEKAALQELDPPLNLQGMAPSPARRRLTELRRPFS